MVSSVDVDHHLDHMHNPCVLLLLFNMVSDLIFNHNKSYLISKKQKL